MPPHPARGTSILRAGQRIDSLSSQTGTRWSCPAATRSLLQSGGTNITMSGDDGLTLTSARDGHLHDRRVRADALVESGGKNVTMKGGADADSGQPGSTKITLGGDYGRSDTVQDSVDDSIAGGR